jgi:hypothetical protein
MNKSWKRTNKKREIMKGKLMSKSTNKKAKMSNNSKKTEQR